MDQFITTIKTYNKEDIYEGQFKNGNPDGIGKYTYADGYIISFNII